MPRNVRKSAVRGHGRRLSSLPLPTSGVHGRVGKNRAAELRKRQLRDAMDRFRTLDVNGSGALSNEELSNLIPGDEHQVALLLAKFDENGDGELQMKEFIALYKFIWMRDDSRMAHAAALNARDALKVSGLVEDHSARLFTDACEGEEEERIVLRLLSDWTRSALIELRGDFLRRAHLDAFIAHLKQQMKLPVLPSPSTRFVAAFAAHRMDAMLEVMPHHLTDEWKAEVLAAWSIARLHMFDGGLASSAAAPPAAAPATEATSDLYGERQMVTPLAAARKEGRSSSSKKSSTRRTKTSGKKRSGRKGSPLSGKGEVVSGARVRVNRHGSVFIG